MQIRITSIDADVDKVKTKIVDKISAVISHIYNTAKEKDYINNQYVDYFNLENYIAKELIDNNFSTTIINGIVFVITI